MEKLSEVKLDNCLTVAVNCQVDQTIITQNFAIVMEALRELQKAQTSAGSNSNADSSLADQLAELRKRMERIEEREPGSGRKEEKSPRGGDG